MPSYNLECNKCLSNYPFSGKYIDAIQYRCPDCNLPMGIVFLPGTKLPIHQGQTTRGPKK